MPTRELFTGTYGKRTILLAAVWILAYGGMIYGQGSYLSLFLVGRTTSTPISSSPRA